MKIYMAAQYNRREEMARKAQYARENGILVVSTWLAPPTVNNPDSVEEMPWWGREAETDIRDIDTCDVFVLFAEPPGALQPRGGRHVEMGYALGLGKEVCVIGESENVFQSLRSVNHYDTFEEFVDVFKPARLQLNDTINHNIYPDLNSMLKTLTEMLIKTR